MKKFLIVSVLVLFSITALFAESSDFNPWDNAFKNPSPFLNSREYGIEYALFNNPAALRGRKFQLSVPVSVTGFRAGDFLANYKKSDGLGGNLADYISKMGYGEERLAVASTGIFTGFKGFALGTYVNAEVQTKSENSVISTELYPVVAVGVATGFGLRVFDNGAMTADAGVTVHADAHVASSESISIDTLVNASSNTELFLNTLKNDSAKCLAVTVDAGARFGFLNDSVVVNASVNRIPVGFWDFNITTKKLDKLKAGENRKTIANRWDVGVGVLLQKEYGPFDLALSVDYFDIVHADYKNYKVKTVLAHTNIRATADVWNAIKATAALNAGDVELGLGFDLCGNEVDLVYKVVEFTDKIGDSPVDSLTVKVRVGLDFNSKIGR